MRNRITLNTDFFHAVRILNKEIFYTIMFKTNLLYKYIKHHVGKHDKKTKINFKIYDITDWMTNNYNTYIAQYLKK